MVKKQYRYEYASNSHLSSASLRYSGLVHSVCVWYVYAAAPTEHVLCLFLISNCFFLLSCNTPTISMFGFSVLNFFMMKLYVSDLTHFQAKRSLWYISLASEI